MTQAQIDQLYHHYQQGNGVFSDTRRSILGGLFFALSGPNFDGNKFADEALSNGAKIVVIDDLEYRKDERYIIVDNTLEALQNLATYHRSKFEGPVIAITGSNGKTTTKELVTAVLSEKHNLIATIGNLNNHIGVPLTLLRISKKTELAVIEMGANHQEEIKHLCEISEPTHGLITNIGKAHIEGFGSLEGIQKGKGELYDYLYDSGGHVFVNSMDATLKEMASKFDHPSFYPAVGDYSRTELVEAQPYVKIKGESGNEINTRLIGEYNFMNIAAGFCLGKYFGVEEVQIEKAISSYVPQSNRSQIVEKGSNIIILDAYNANPDSMEAALNSLDSLPGLRKAVILGDMLELGDDEIEEHRNLGHIVSQIKPAMALFCGTLIEHSAKQVPQSEYFSSKSLLEDYLEKNPISNAIILIKASRGIGLETILDLI